VRDLSIRFGGLQALENFTLQVNEFEIVGLIGPNGAGKTTAFNCITGFYKPDTGTVTYRGTDVTRVPPHRKAAMGFGRTFQNVGMVKGSSVIENLKTAQHARVEYDVVSGLVGTPGVIAEERALAEKADAILELLDLTEVRNSRVGGLSYGTLKLLELGCALATEPDILLLDEPSSGMGPEEAHQLGERLIDLRQAFGLTMLLIEHHVPLVLSVCDHIYVLNFGRLLAEGQPSVIQTHPEVVAAYLGGEAPEALDATEETDTDAALHAQIGHPEVAHEVADVDDAPTEVIDAAVAEKPRRTTKAAPRKRGKTAAEQREEQASSEPTKRPAPRKRTTK
jgi:branched-chain amino acid transport system ATP-binding protein